MGQPVLFPVAFSLLLREEIKVRTPDDLLPAQLQILSKGLVATKIDPLLILVKNQVGDGINQAHQQLPRGARLLLGPLTLLDLPGHGPDHPTKGQIQDQEDGQEKD